eukprot:TRINITY_DN3532_c0_g1_i2.p1 TRINITY_DN3532_c0_g1~~TRINITY_DN3532_c0_g1_i2.p1  ORF type:complete len:889 (+),score=180.04 TRINITY_DN3532_c0_g1_i2:145-2811(+)
MLRSLVGSEMCIRDRPSTPQHQQGPELLPEEGFSQPSPTPLPAEEIHNEEAASPASSLSSSSSSANNDASESDVTSPTNSNPEPTVTATTTSKEEVDSSFSPTGRTPDPHKATAPNSYAGSPDNNHIIHNNHTNASSYNNPPTSHHRLEKEASHDIRNLTVGSNDDEHDDSPTTTANSARATTTTTTTSAAEIAALEDRLTTIVKDSSAKDMKVVFEQLAEMKEQQQQVNDESSRLRGDLREFMEKVAITTSQQQNSPPSSENNSSNNNAAIVATMEANAAAAAEKHNNMLVESEVRIERMLSGLVSKLEGQQSSQIYELKESMAATLRRVEERVLSLETASKKVNIRQVSSSEEGANSQYYSPPPPSSGSSGYAPFATNSAAAESASPNNKSIYASGGTRRPSVVTGGDVRSVAPMTGRSQSPPANPNIPGGGRASMPTPPPSQQPSQPSPSPSVTQRSESSIRRVDEESAAAAAAASQAALPELRTLMDSAEFRSALHSCCPRLSSFSTEELLTSLGSEYQAAEVVTGFTARQSKQFFWGFSIEDGMENNRFLNQWEDALSHNMSFDGGHGWFSTQDDVETNLYGLKPFEHRGDPASMSEAGERGVYTVINTMRADMGSPLYGDVSAVLRTEATAQQVIISAIDTGEWTALCTPANWTRPGYEHNCSAYHFQMGTQTHFWHLVLANMKYWQRELSTTLARHALLLLEAGEGTALVGSDLFTYWEGMPAVQLGFPESVKFLIGSFRSLFGTAEGSQLQQWAAKEGWVLCWALGLNDDQIEPQFWNIATATELNYQVRRRLVDPQVLSHTSVANLTAHNMSAFQAVWTQVASQRRQHLNITNLTWSTYWSAFEQALPVTHAVDIVRANSCHDRANCVGVDKDGHCVCY